MPGSDVFAASSFAAGYYSTSVTYDAGADTATVVDVATSDGGAAARLDGTVTNAGDPVAVTFDTAFGPLVASYTAVFDCAEGIVLTDGFGGYLAFAAAALSANQVLSAAAGFGNFVAYAPAPACFAAGTRIATARGPAAVETLRPGMLVETGLRRGLAAVEWLGHLTIDFAGWPNPADGWPVRVCAGAFGPGRPCRDIRLSPHHAVFFEGVLLPVAALIDGSRILQEPCRTVTYWHVELARHDLLLAEGLPVESYFDADNRDSFACAAGTPPHAAPSGRCAPLVTDGPRLLRLRQRLHARAGTRGQSVTPVTSMFAQSWRGGATGPSARNVTADASIMLAVR